MYLQGTSAPAEPQIYAEVCSKGNERRHHDKDSKVIMDDECQQLHEAPVC